MYNIYSFREIVFLCMYVCVRIYILFINIYTYRLFYNKILNIFVFTYYMNSKVYPI